MSSSINVKYSAHPTSNELLVLIHGLFGSLDNLSFIHRHFEQSHNVLSVDLPNHGRSTHISGFSLERCVELLLPVISDHANGPVYVLGHSLGGKVAMLMALNNPDTMQKLVVADIAPVKYPSLHDAIITSLGNVNLEKLHTRSDADTQLSEGIPETGIRQFLLKSLWQTPEKQWKWRFNLDDLAENYANIRGWPEIQKAFPKPSLFVKGGNSNYITKEMQSAIVSKFPNAKAHIIENAGHWLHAEKPVAFNNVIERFLASQ